MTFCIDSRQQDPTGKKKKRKWRIKLQQSLGIRVVCRKEPGDTTGTATVRVHISQGVIYNTLHPIDYKRFSQESKSLYSTGSSERDTTIQNKNTVCAVQFVSSSEHNTSPGSLMPRRDGELQGDKLLLGSIRLIIDC